MTNNDKQRQMTNNDKRQTKTNDRQWQMTDNDKWQTMANDKQWQMTNNDQWQTMTYENYYQQFLQISAFFLIFEEGRLLYIHPVGRLVGWSVGRLVDVTINFFQCIEAYKPFINPVPLNTKPYQVILTQYHQVPTSTALYWPSTIIYQYLSIQPI